MTFHDGGSRKLSGERYQQNHQAERENIKAGPPTLEAAAENV